MQTSLFRRLQAQNTQKCSEDCRGWTPWLDTHACLPGESWRARPCGHCWRHYPRDAWPSEPEATRAYWDDLGLRRFAEPARRLLLSALIACSGNLRRVAHEVQVPEHRLERIVRAHPELLRAKLTLELDAQEARQDATGYDIGC